MSKRANRPVPTLIEEIAMTQEDRIDMLAALLRDLIDYLDEQKEDYDYELRALLGRAEELLS